MSASSSSPQKVLDDDEDDVIQTIKTTPRLPNIFSKQPYTSVLSSIKEYNYSITRLFCKGSRIIGLTASHAFTIEQKDCRFYLHCIDHIKTTFDTPFAAARANRPFVSPWKLYHEPFMDYLGACAFEDSVCIIMSNKVHVLSANWTTKWISSSFRASKIVSSTMNNAFVVIATENEIFVFSQVGDRDRAPIIKHAVSAKSVQLLTGDNNNCLIVTRVGSTNKSTIYDITSIETENGGMFFVMDDLNEECSPMLMLNQRKDFTLFDKPSEVVCVREYSPGLVMQLSADTACLQWNSKGCTSIKTCSLMTNMIVDVCVSSNGLVVVHDSKNKIHFFGEFQTEIIKGDEICQSEYNLDIPMHEALVSYKSTLIDETNNRVIILLPSGSLTIIQL